MAPGMKAVGQTSHQAHAMAQNAFLLRKLRDSATKEATTAWVEVSEPYKTKKEIIEMIDNKPQYKGFVKVHERTIRHLVAEGVIRVTPPHRGHDGLQHYEHVPQHHVGAVQLTATFGCVTPSLLQ